jgi:hypothetical protein
MSIDESVNDNSDNRTVIDLEIPIHLKEPGIIQKIGIHKQLNNIVVKLGNKYSNRDIVSEINHSSWEKTTSNFRNRLRSRGIDDHEITQLEDILDSNYEKVLGYDERTQELSSTEGTCGTRQSGIRKYTCNGTKPLHECIVIGRKPTFVYLEDNDKKNPKYATKILIGSRTLYPSETLDSQNPIPYIWESPEEFDRYLNLAEQETFDSLFTKVRSVFRKYVNIEDHYVNVLSADTIFSYFQDKFPTVHYNIFIGDNGSGKNSALLVYRHLGYRVLYVTSASAPNYFTFLGEIEECHSSIAEDEADDIGYDKDKLKVLKTGYSTGRNVLKVDLSKGRTQGSYLTYCLKWFEHIPELIHLVLRRI